ncbi:MAG TPA: hypothetical protein VK424_08435 [Thermoplasmata archaeon]|nr:hypothetical protein [Thermoplasmata archaeon]
MTGAYPIPVQAYPTPRVRTPSGESAATLVRVGVLFQLLGAAILCVGLLFLLGFGTLGPLPFAWVALLVTSTIGLAAVGLLCLAYDRAYLPIQRGEFRAARSPTLVLGFLSLPLGVIPGVLLLAGYTRLGEAAREQETQWVAHSR